MKPHSITEALVHLSLLSQFGLVELVSEAERQRLLRSVELFDVCHALVERGLLIQHPSGSTSLSERGYRMLGALAHTLYSPDQCVCEEPSGGRVPCNREPCDCAGRCTRCGGRVDPSPEYL